MDYASAVASAPEGWRHFELADVQRLPASARSRALAAVPPQELKLLESGDEPARERVRRALFWTLVYHLEPDRWEQLAQVEPIHPGLLDALPHEARRAIDVGAGTGRLTAHLVERCREVIAVEPVLGMARILQEKVVTAHAVAAWAEALPIPDGWSDLTIACGAFGPEPAILDEMFRVTKGDGLIALISPEQPEVFESMGWRRVSLEPRPAPIHEGWIDEFFGPLDPPHEMVFQKLDQARAAR